MSLFEAVQTTHIRAATEAIWELWADPARWPDWDQRLERADVDGELAPGAEVRLKLKQGGTSRYQVTDLDRGRLLVLESRFPGALVGHEHRLAPASGGAEVTHRIYIEGPAWALWAVMLGRKRLRGAVEQMGERERELATPLAPQRRPKRRR